MSMHLVPINRGGSVMHCFEQSDVIEVHDEINNV